MKNAKYSDFFCRRGLKCLSVESANFCTSRQAGAAQRRRRREVQKFADSTLKHFNPRQPPLQVVEFRCMPRPTRTWGVWGAELAQTLAPGAIYLSDLTWYFALQARPFGYVVCSYYPRRVTYFVFWPEKGPLMLHEICSSKQGKILHLTQG
jgi:hypothetical protein